MKKTYVHISCWNKQWQLAKNYLKTLGFAEISEWRDSVGFLIHVTLITTDEQISVQNLEKELKAVYGRNIIA